MKKLIYGCLAICLVAFTSCQKKDITPKKETTKSPMQEKVDEFATVRLTTDLSTLTSNEKELIKRCLTKELICHLQFKQQGRS